MHELHPASFGFWKSGRVWLAALVQVLKARFGLTWNVKRACMFGKPYRKGQAVPTYPRCPLCGGRDSIGHMLGECACPEIQAIIIERHNGAARLILAAVLAAALGACEVYADVGSLAKLGG